ncbi:MAG: ATP-binding cassette domain-containing protein, partial [Treponema sp.]|nr:ATP-binding cassette domain-containing protein [Treponema sp.]
SFPLTVLRATPVAALILILVFSLSSSIVPVTSAVLMALPLVTTNIREAVEASAKNSKTKEMARIFGLTKKQRLLYILLPNLSPSLKASSVSSFGMTWKVVAAGEILCLPRTAIGSELAKAQVHLETSQVLAYTLTLIITSYFFESLLKFLCREKGHAPASKKPDPKNYMPQISQNERLALIAPSGFGKTTLLDYLSKTNESVSYSFQDNRLLEELTVIQNIAIPLFRIFSESEAKEKSLYYIEKTFLSGKKDLKVKYLSGGEKQRVALARALAYPSKLLLLDESFNAQDYELKMSLMNFVKKELDKKPRTLVFVTHDERDANFLCSRVAKLHSSANFNDSIEKNRFL